MKAQLPVPAPAGWRSPIRLPSISPRTARFAALSLTVVILAFAVLDAIIVLPVSLTYQGGAAVGMDYGIYMDRTHDWLAGDGFYRARQLTGQPYEILNGDSFYPPTLLFLLVPFALGLPAVLWWLIPIAIIAAALVHIRPPMWTWPIMAFALLLPRASLVLVLGNPSLWMIAAAFAGVAWAWPSALLLLKPTLAPFALIGIRHRSWWITLGALVLLSVPFGALWRDYVTALVNAQNARGLEYTLGEWPLMIAPLAAWVGQLTSAASRRPPRARPGAQITAAAGALRRPLVIPIAHHTQAFGSCGALGSPDTAAEAAPRRGRPVHRRPTATPSALSRQVPLQFLLWFGTHSWRRSSRWWLARLVRAQLVRAALVPGDVVRLRRIRRPPVPSSGPDAWLSGAEPHVHTDLGVSDANHTVMQLCRAAADVASVHLPGRGVPVSILPVVARDSGPGFRGGRPVDPSSARVAVLVDRCLPAHHPGDLGGDLQHPRDRPPRERRVSRRRHRHRLQDVCGSRPWSSSVAGSASAGRGSRSIVVSYPFSAVAAIPDGVSSGSGALASRHKRGAVRQSLLTTPAGDGPAPRSRLILGSDGAAIKPGRQSRDGPVARARHSCTTRGTRLARDCTSGPGVPSPPRTIPGMLTAGVMVVRDPGRAADLLRQMRHPRGGRLHDRGRD